MARASAPPARKPTATPTLEGAAKVAGWGMVFWAGAQIAATVFSRNATATVAVQAALAEWGAGWMAISWSDPLAPIPGWPEIRRRAGTGLALGLGAAGLGVGCALATGAAVVAERSFGGGLLAIGLLVAVLSAVRDELLLRGVALKVTRGLLPGWASLLACGACAAAARFGVEGTLGLGLAIEGLRGVALGALWVRDRGAWMAIAANTGWIWMVSSVTHGGLVDVRFVGWMGQSESSAPLALVAAAAAAAIAAVLWARRRL
jgi:hypothetical protein